MYSARITRQTPTAFVILIDQSGSMQEKAVFNSMEMSKADAVAFATNTLISELLFRCRREDENRDYFDIAVLGYSGQHVRSLIGNNSGFIKSSQLSHMDVTIRDIVRERRLPNGDTVITTTQHKCWIAPKAQGTTPMCAALVKAQSLVSQWCRRDVNKASYPPTIFNITDGEATDGSYQELLQIADSIKSLSTLDGGVLLINIHIASDIDNAEVIFPCSTDELPTNKYAHLLFDMSSILPIAYYQHAKDVKGGLSAPVFRGMSYNTSVNDLIAIMNIGSISVNFMQ